MKNAAKLKIPTAEMNEKEKKKKTQFTAKWKWLAIWTTWVVFVALTNGI